MQPDFFKWSWNINTQIARLHGLFLSSFRAETSLMLYPGCEILRAVVSGARVQCFFLVWHAAPPWMLFQCFSAYLFIILFCFVTVLLTFPGEPSWTSVWGWFLPLPPRIRGVISAAIRALSSPLWVCQVPGVEFPEGLFPSSMTFTPALSYKIIAQNINETIKAKKGISTVRNVLD